MPTPAVPDQQALLDPKNDFVFKKLFAGAPHLLVALINAVRVGESPVVQLEVLNPAITPEDLTGKYIVLDILAQDALGLRFNIEMQVRRFNAYSARSTYYLAHALTQQIGGGQNYHEIKGVIGIHLLDFDLFEGPGQQGQAVWCFEMRDRQQPQVKLGNELQLNIIEMRKADRLKLAPSELADLLTFFEHWQEESIMANITSTAVQQALDRLKTISADQATRHQAWVRERAVWDEISEKRAERELGKLEGKLEGKLGGQALVLARLLEKRFGALPDDLRGRLDHATDEQLEHWTDAVLDAPTLGAVFASH